jgi:L-ascorbate metabolism protein UlaG (beta-lactamase superfamily)
VSAATRDATTLYARPLGGPTVLLEVAGLRLLTDPTFDDPGDYARGSGYTLTKTVGPATDPDGVGPIDVVLLSHDQHPDNLDTRGRAFLGCVPRVLTTVAGAARLGGHATSLPRWSHVDVRRPQGGTLRITGVPALHGPDGTDHLTGEVTGFVLSGEGLPTVYVSGDNASLAVVRAIAERLGPMDSAVLFAGAAQTPLLGDAHLTLDARGAVAAARIVGARRVLPVHVDSWAHVSEGLEAVCRAFEDAGLSDRLVRVARGAVTVL